MKANIKKIALLAGIAIFLASGLISVKFFSTSKTANTKVSGMYFGNQEWGGEIAVTGDTEIIGNLTVSPGTNLLLATIAAGAMKLKKMALMTTILPDCGHTLPLILVFLCLES